MIRRLCVDECVGATGNLSPPMSNKAKKTSNRLTVLFVNSNKLAPGLYGDGNNLFLSVRPSGSRSWVFRFRERGGNRIRDMGLGTAGPDGVPLQAARDRAVALRADLRAGRDPIADKKAAAAAAPEAPQKTFGDYAINDWCQSASNFDPFERRVLTVALASSELAGVAETWRARAV